MAQEWVKCTAQKRDMAFSDLTLASYAIQLAALSSRDDDMQFWKDAAKDNIRHARDARIARKNYPTLP